MNTDDYEGHTPGPWKLVEGDPYDELGCWLDIVSEHGDGFGPFEIQQCVGFSDGEDDPNVKLMVAAPNLLAEVKRLRGEPELNKCPTCGSSDITIYDSFVDSGSHKVRCEGDGCESRWFEIWRHVGIEMIEGEDNR